MFNDLYDKYVDLFIDTLATFGEDEEQIALVCDDAELEGLATQDIVEALHEARRYFIE